MLNFLLNHQLISLNSFKPDTTLLDYLRSRPELTGSKEGCASGDCGACTVVVAELNQDKNGLIYRSLNSCICLLGTLHGKQLITVEGLKEDNQLHPVQQAMVEQHASQCGFCTPGFVMSIFAMTKQPAKTVARESIGLRDSIVENIDGNLCRCTGYRPIIDAAQQVLIDDVNDHFNRQEAQTIRQLSEIESHTGHTAFFAPTSAKELSPLLLKHPQARLLAGGTDLVLEATQGLQSFDTIIYLGQVKELTNIEESDDSIRLGAAVSYQGAKAILSREYPDLLSHLQRLGSKQIRNVATIGGNIANASPIGDMPPVLLALGASLRLQKGDEERSVDIADFYIDYKKTQLQTGEFIRHIELPKIQSFSEQFDQYLKVYKISKRHADDISAICFAGYLQIDKKTGLINTVRIGVGGMAATVKRATQAEQALLNHALNAETLTMAQAQIVNDFEPLDDVRASREYRLLMAQNLLERLFRDLGADL